MKGKQPTARVDARESNACLWQAVQQYCRYTWSAAKGLDTAVVGTFPEVVASTALFASALPPAPSLVETIGAVSAGAASRGQDAWNGNELSLHNRYNDKVNTIRHEERSLLLVGLIFGRITFTNCFASAHSLHVAGCPRFRRFFCEFVNFVCSGVFPHIRHPVVAAAEEPPTCALLSVAGKFRDCINANISRNERKAT